MKPWFALLVEEFVAMKVIEAAEEALETPGKGPFQGKA